MNLQSPTENKFGFLRARFDFEYHAKHFDIDLVFYSGSSLSHYTNLQGLLGIIESGGFWLSDHRYLNDREEFENGRRLTIDILNRLASKSRYKAFSSILLAASSRLKNHKESPYYVCSFSRVADDLNQWRSYGQNGQGVSITFENPSSASHFKAPPVLTTSKVIYRDLEKIKILLLAIRKYGFEHGVDLKYNNAIDIKDWADYLATDLAFTFIKFKHPAFSSEQEIRLIAASVHIEHFQGIKHRIGKHGVIPYISSAEVFRNDATFQLKIKEITVGPTADQDIVTSSIKTYLTNKEINGVDVVKSKIPYRG